MAAPNPYQMLVEGAEDKRVLPELLEKRGVVWELAPKKYYTDIQDCEGIDNIVREGFIATKFKSSGLRALGIVVDADGIDPSQPSRVINVLRQCRLAVPDFDWTLDPAGIVATDSSGKRLGLWVMPDNANPGMLENLLLTLPPPEQRSLVDFAKRATQEARVYGAPFVEAHQHKAILHTWLSWQDPPGRQLHQAIQENMLVPESPAADAFVAWFARLFPAPPV